MLERKPIIIYCFSGTGNTLLVARKMKEAFEKQKYTVELKRITVSEPADLCDDCHLGLVVPVAIQSTFPIVWNFVERLPEGNGRKVFLADTMESFSGGIVGPMKKLLTAKGYCCIGAKEFKMANSMQTSKKKAESEKKNSEEALPEAEKYAQALIEERTKWRRIPVLSDWMRAISKGRTIWTKTSEKLKIDPDMCIKCGICEKHCPVGAIHLEDQQMKIRHQQCIACMRCANYCPKNAIQLGGKRVIQKRVVKVNEL